MRVVAGLLFNAEGQVLVALRPAHKPYGNMWEIPGGKLEDKEGYRKALCRELYEELGIVVEPRHLRRIVSQSFGPTDHVYAIRTWQGEPQALASQCLTWTPVNESLLQVDATPLTMVTFHHLLQSASESL